MVLAKTAVIPVGRHKLALPHYTDRINQMHKIPKKSQKCENAVHLEHYITVSLRIFMLSLTLNLTFLGLFISRGSLFLLCFCHVGAKKVE